MMNKKSILVNGPVSPKKLGDALLYGVSVKLVNQLLTDSQVTLMCQNLSDSRNVFQEMNFNAQLLDSSNVGYLALLNSLRLSPLSSKTTPKRLPACQNQHQPHQKALPYRSILYDRYSRYIPPIWLPDQLLNEHALGHPSFDAGLIAGHTCGIPSIQSFIVNYELVRSFVHGPLVTFPISFSCLAIMEKLSAINRATTLKKLKNVLQKFDRVYVRGPYSQKILTDLGLENVDIALDTGFGIRLFQPLSSRKTEKYTILITPRRDYVDTIGYSRKSTYTLYLHAMADFIVWATENVDCNIVLTSQTETTEAIDDLMCELRRRATKSTLESLRVVIPNSIVESYELYNSSDFVITSYMHGGINALTSGVPTLFIMPLSEIKLLDILAFLGLNVKVFALDMFDDKALESSNLIEKAKNIIQNTKQYKKVVEYSIRKKMDTIDYPVKTLGSLLE